MNNVSGGRNKFGSTFLKDDLVGIFKVCGKLFCSMAGTVCIVWEVFKSSESSPASSPDRVDVSSLRVGTGSTGATGITGRGLTTAGCCCLFLSFELA